MSSNKKHRIQKINQMLLEMASGNFHYRLERSTKNDNLEAISISLNMLAEEIQETMRHQGYANSNNASIETVQMVFLLDEHGLIEMANQQTCTILSVLYSDIIGNSFESLLDETSKTLWIKTWMDLTQKDFYDTALELKFNTKSSLVIPKICHITTIKDKGNNLRKTLITIIHHSSSQEDLEKNLKQGVLQFTSNQKQASEDSKTRSQKQKLRLSFEDIRKIREGHDIIINNLEMDFPSLKDFALQLGTNEFKLKYGFKELYGTSVYRFLKEERLRKSKMMIQFTDQSLKTIAQMTGFKSMAHFSRTFKKRYGYTPSELRKKALNGDK